MASINGTTASETLTGTDGNDTINGYGGTDILRGLGGDDRLYGDAGADRLEGGDGKDTLYGFGGDDTLLGGAGADYIDGGDGRDVLNGGDGDDEITFGYDQVSDTLTGGAGADWFKGDLANGYTKIGMADVVTDFSVAEGDQLYLGITDGRDFSNYLIWYGAITSPDFSLTVGAALPDAPEPGFESISTWTSGGSTYLIIDRNSNGMLNDGDFVLEFRGLTSFSRDMLPTAMLQASIGTTGADFWSGTSTHDVYFGFAGADVANGLVGADRLDGGAGDDTLSGGDGDDYLYGGLGGDTLDGGDGNDTLYAGLNSYFDDNDTADSVNTLRGGDGNDMLYAGNGKDVLEGGAGNDLLTVLTVFVPPGDVFKGGEGNDELRTANAILDGGAGDDTLWITAGNTITGGTGADLFKGGNYTYPRWTTYGVSSITDFNAAEGDRIYIGEASSFSRGSLVFRGAVNSAGFSPAVGQAYATDDFGADFVQAWTWADGSATYLFVDLDRNGTVSAEDLVVKFTNGATITADSFLPGYFKGTMGSAGVDAFTGGAGDDIYYGAGGDDLIHGNGGDDFLAGNAGADKIWGETGNDWLKGGDGDDVLEGGDGNDQLDGGRGSDTLIGGEGNDHINALGDASSILLDTDLVYGGLGNDQLSGGLSATSETYGGEGDDYISGGGRLFGDAGADSVFGDRGAIAHGGDGDDRMSSGDGGATLYGDAGSDTFMGGSGADVIHADMGDAQVYGGSGNDEIHIGAVRAGEKAVLTYVGGGEGNDTFIVETPLGAATELSFYGDYDFDTLDLSHATTAVTVDLSLNTVQETGMGRFRIGAIEAVVAGDFGSVLKGDAGANRFVGGAVGDTLNGGGGSDVLRGNGGDDVMDGGDGVDIAEYAGASTNYSWSVAADGSVQVKDLRAGAPDGVDKLTGVEILRFSDRNVVTGATVGALPGAEAGFAAIYRMSLKAGVEFGPTASVALAAAIGTYEQGVKEIIVPGAVATTSVASLNYQFFTGKIPTEAGFDFLISPTGPNSTNLNSAYYAKFDTINRYINFAVNLGKNGEAKESFLAKYGAVTLFDATRDVYKMIFGSAPTDAKVHELLDTRVDYLAYYGGDGANGIGTKAAMVGFLLAAAATEGKGVFAAVNRSWLFDLSDGSAPFAIDLIDPANHYWRPEYAL